MNWLRTRLARMSARQRAILVSVVTVLLAVVVILVVSALSAAPEYESDTQAALGNSEASMILLEKALLAEESGDTTRALALLQRAMDIDGNNTDAASELERIRDQVPVTPVEPEDPVEPDPSPTRTREMMSIPRFLNRSMTSHSCCQRMLRDGAWVRFLVMRHQQTLSVSRLRIRARWRHDSL